MMNLKTFTFMASLMLCTSLMAKDIKVLVVKTAPEMHCNNCETKIKNNIRFVSGVKKIDTSLEKKTVTITYDADKTDSKAIVAAFKKIKYEATVVSDAAVKDDNSNVSPKPKALRKLNKLKKIDGQTGATQQQ